MIKLHGLSEGRDSEVHHEENICILGNQIMKKKISYRQKQFILPINKEKEENMYVVANRHIIEAVR